jgi:hypothetical protein
MSHRRVPQLFAKQFTKIGIANCCRKVQTDGPLTFAKTIENTVHELNSDLAVFDVTTLELRNQFAGFG